MNLTIGVQKDYLLDNGFTANFWRTGRVEFSYSENSTNEEELNLKVDMILFKDQATALTNGKNTGVKKVVVIKYKIGALDVDSTEETLTLYKKDIIVGEGENAKTHTRYNINGMIEFLYDEIMKDEYFSDGTRITPTI